MRIIILSLAVLVVAGCVQVPVEPLPQEKGLPKPQSFDRVSLDPFNDDLFGLNDVDGDSDMDGIENMMDDDDDDDC